MTGTSGNPINIDGKVVIDGDVVIRGYIKGTGQLYVTGNIYMPGDLIYADANVGQINETFGKAADGTQNLVGMSAGKNIVIGDYLSQITTWSSGDANEYQGYRYDNTTNTLKLAPGQPEPGKKAYYAAGDANNNYLNTSFVGSQPTVYLPYDATDTTKTAKYPDGTVVPSGTKFAGSNEPSFIMQQVALFNRDELMKTMPYLPTKDPTKAANYTTANGAVVNDGAANHSPAATAYDPNYIPKFYSMYPYDGTNSSTQQINPALVLMYSGSTYIQSAQTWNGVADPHGYEYMTSVDQMPAGSISPAATYAKNVINIHPDWITPNNMMQIISSEQAARVKVVADAQYGSSSGTIATAYQLPDRRLDGVMYTKNAIFCIERSYAQKYDPVSKTWTRVGSVSGGHLQVNGAMIAPDTGILVNGSAADDFTSRKTFIVNYDVRAKNLMALTNQNFNSYNSWGMTRVSMVRNTGFAP